MKTNFYYINIRKHEYGKNMIKTWCKIVLKTIVERTKGNEGSYFYLYPFEKAFKEASMCASNK
jgi:hypothetical protein